MTRPRRAVFLDRDGVLNQAVIRDGKPYAPAGPAEVRLVEGAAQALQALKDAGFLLIVVTNQPDVARGRQTTEAVHRIHDLLRESLPVDQFLVCFHDDADQCLCRKPKPGLLRQAAREHMLELSQSFMIGDRWRDIDAGHEAGCVSILIDRGYHERGPATEPEARVATLGEAVQWILGRVPAETEDSPCQPPACPRN